MQIGRAGFVAAGALATVAVMGSAAAAAPDTAQLDAAAAATTLEIDETLPVALANPVARIGDDNLRRPLISIGTGSNVMAAAWQICGSTAVAGVGASAPISSPNTVIGDCANANTVLRQDQAPALISILDDSSINAVPWQICGSNVVAGVGATAAVNSPNTVTGDCHNANTLIMGPKGPGPKSLISVLSGSVINAAAWQACGSTAVMGVGVAAGAQSPTTVLGDCTNAGILIEPRGNDAEIPILSNADLNLLPLQFCGQEDLVSLVGLAVPLDSPGFVGGVCESPELVN